MARDLKDSTYYTSTEDGKIPIRWTSPEVMLIHDEDPSIILSRNFRRYFIESTHLPVMCGALGCYSMKFGV